MVDVETRILAAMQLSAIGDALGWITEFISDETGLMRKYGCSTIQTFIPWTKAVGGRFYGYRDNVCAGSYSDDTQLMLAVARCTAPSRPADVVRFARQELPAWLAYARGGGRTVKTAAQKIQRRHASWSDNFFAMKSGEEVIDYRDCGANGAAMRILPIALAGAGDWARIRRDIFSNSIVSHGHARGLLGALLYASAVTRILRCESSDFDPEGYLVDLGKSFRSDVELPFLAEPPFVTWTDKWSTARSISFDQHYSSVVDETLELLRTVLRHLKESASIRQAFQALGCFEGATRGSGTHTVAAAIYLVCRHHAEPSVGITAAVNAFGADTDSIAAFAGGMLGALHGETVIPQRWFGVQDREYIQKLARRLAGCESEKEEPSFAPSAEVQTEIDLLSDYSDSLSQGMRCGLGPLGTGTITAVDRQSTLTKGRYNLIVDARFDVGQTCRVAKLFSDPVLD